MLASSLRAVALAALPWQARGLSLSPAPEVLLQRAGVDAELRVAEPAPEDQVQEVLTKYLIQVRFCVGS